MQFCEVCGSIIRDGKCSNKRCGKVEPKQKPEPWQANRDICAVNDMGRDRVRKARQQ